LIGFAGLGVDALERQCQVLSLHTLYGTNSSNLSGSISRDSSTSTSQQTTHNNTNLTATNINLNTTQDTKIKGGCCWYLG
jgi:hypothetical protein